jgi:hypothetical protein
LKKENEEEFKELEEKYLDNNNNGFTFVGNKNI